LNLPVGYRYAATYAGIRAVAKDDLALIVSALAANTAAVFTQNRVQAAPVRLARRNLKTSRGRAGAILINAGNANCATRTGDRVALATCRAAAKLLRFKTTEILPASTGVIGVELDAKLITGALPSLVAALTDDGFERVSRAIMTTDTVPKTASEEVRLRRGAIRVAGMTKGAGMIHPQMATTLAFVLTDAAIPLPLLRQMLVNGNALSYSRISVDGDTSTNDTLALVANGASGVRPDAKEMALVEAAITRVMQSLAVQIVRDGEGAKKLITIEVRGAKDNAHATAIARAIANSPLVKTAIAGSDPNWGRIICAAGNSGVEFDPAKVDIEMHGVAVCKAGLAAVFTEAELKQKLDAADCPIRFSIRGPGKGSATFWTCDFTKEYIDINASYRT
jgi:glutamate N-acetyltransferase/amino-acid N-acetyltransferase